MDYTRNQNEQFIFAQLQQGNEAAFDFLFQQYYAGLCVFASKYTHDTDVSEELVQSVFCKIWDDRQKINIATSLKSYLFTSVRNRCLDFIKHQGIRLKVHQSIIEQYESLPDNADFYVVAELAEQIEKALELLPSNIRIIFELNRFDGLTYKEIAERLNISPKTVEANMSKALKFLREELKDYLPALLFLLHF